MPVLLEVLTIETGNDIGQGCLCIAKQSVGYVARSIFSMRYTSFKNFSSGLYDLVLLDIKMQGDRFHLYQKIKRVDSRIKICFLTATEYFHEEIRKEHGFDEFSQETFLRKPIEIKDLVREIKSLLEADRC